jgi:phage FluMu protein Com
MNKHIIHLKIIPEPSSIFRKVLVINPPEIVFFSGDGNTNFLCGKCGALLADSIAQGTITGVVLKCNRCQSYNDTSKSDNID